MHDLEVFNEKYEKLLSLKFTESINNLRMTIAYLDKGDDVNFNGITLTQKSKQKEFIEVTGPKGEEIDAFILTFRLFIQGNEKVSIRNISKVYENHVKDDALVNEFITIKSELNAYLDGMVQNSINKSRPSERITISRRQILESIIYGLYAHYKSDKREFYEDYLMNDKYYLFFTIVRELNKYFKKIYELNKRALSYWQF